MFCWGVHCPDSDIRYTVRVPSMLSFISAVGACQCCRGLGGVIGVVSGLVVPIDKLTLLNLLNEAYGANVIIRPSSAVRIDRSLDSSRFREATGWSPKPWPALVEAMAADSTPYDEWRNMR